MSTPAEVQLAQQLEATSERWAQAAEKSLKLSNELAASTERECQLTRDLVDATNVSLNWLRKYEAAILLLGEQDKEIAALKGQVSR